MPDAPHETLLTVDATTGQNGVRQAKLFSEAVPVDGIVLTKLDGTAKGGIALAIAGELGIPVKLIGIGEALEDLRPFDADDFAQGAARPLSYAHRSPRTWSLGVLADRGCRRSPWARSPSTGFFLAPFAVGAFVAAMLSRCRRGARSRRSSFFAVIDRRCCSARAAGRPAPPAPAGRRSAPGTAALIGRSAIVLERIANDEGVGCVQASTARSGPRAPTTRTTSSRPASACRSSRSGARPRS